MPQVIEALKLKTKMNTLSKKIKIILFNIILILFILIFFDYQQYKYFVQEYTQNISKEILKVNKIPKYKDCFNRVYSTNTIQSLNKYYKKGDWKYFRKTFNEESEKPSIILFGCSFTYGSFLKDNETFSYKLSNATNRAVYNRGVEGGGLAQMLYFLRDENFYNQIKQPPEYVIYTYITNHQKRLNTNMFQNPLFLRGYNFQYKLKNGKLIIKQNLPDFIYDSFIIKKIYSYFDKINNKPSQKNVQKRFILTNTILIECKNLLEQRYGKIKFIILDYNYEYNTEENDLPDLWNTLEKEGFIIIHTKDLIGRDFSIEETTVDKFHPGKQVWDILVPELIKKLDI